MVPGVEGFISALHDIWDLEKDPETKQKRGSRSDPQTLLGFLSKCGPCTRDPRGGRVTPAHKPSGRRERSCCFQKDPLSRDEASWRNEPPGESSDPWMHFLKMPSSNNGHLSIDYIICPLRWQAHYCPRGWGVRNWVIYGLFQPMSISSANVTHKAIWDLVWLCPVIPVDG